MSYRISVDTGGTFTDVVVTDHDDAMHVGKALTTYQRAFFGVREALEQVAAKLGTDVDEILRETSHFAYGTTRSTNAIVEGKTAQTAFFTTEGFPDVLLLREGGRLGGAFSPREFSAPYVPRYLTFEIHERMDSDGEVYVPLDEHSVLTAIERIQELGVQAVGVSLLWSTVNAAHERRVGELLAKHAPEVAVTLSHELNPILREYRRASSTVIDASLKPLMQEFLNELSADLESAGFRGVFLLSTSFGGSWPIKKMIEQPIYSVGSGPSMAPLAALETGTFVLSNPKPNLLVCDTGGTTFDVSIVSSGEIQYRNDTWLGEQWTGHITGTKSVDVRSIGAGGGSIISIDDAGLVKVGPESAGADPGPACYQRGGTLPTVTDAALVLGYFDQSGFVDGKLKLNVELAQAALQPIADHLGTSLEQAARGCLIIATQNIVSAIREMTISQGIDPRELVLVAGGGASGINVVQIARELDIEQVILPKTAGALSAAGAISADLISDFSASAFTSTNDFDEDAVSRAFDQLRHQADGFLEEISHLNPTDVSWNYSVDARYPGQVWELETAVSDEFVSSQHRDIDELKNRFHQQHLRMFQVNDPTQEVEFLVWKLRIRATLEKPTALSNAIGADREQVHSRRTVHFIGGSEPETPVISGSALEPGSNLAGPAVILEATTTLVLDPGAQLQVANNGDYLIEVGRNEKTFELHLGQDG